GGGARSGELLAVGVGNHGHLPDVSAGHAVGDGLAQHRLCRALRRTTYVDRETAAGVAEPFVELRPVAVGLERRKTDLARNADDLELAPAEPKGVAYRIQAGPHRGGEAVADHRSVVRVIGMKAASLQDRDAVEIEELRARLVTVDRQCQRARAGSVAQPVIVIVPRAPIRRNAV